MIVFEYISIMFGYILKKRNKLKVIIMIISTFVFYDIYEIKAADITEWGATQIPKNLSNNSWETAINNILGFGAILATLMVIYGIVKFILAITNKKNTKEKCKAKKIIIYGFLLIFLFAFIYALVLAGNTAPPIPSV